MKKLIFIICTLGLLSFLVQSCSRDDDQDTIEGTWNGSYDGADDQGVWTATISKERVFSGKTTSTKTSVSQDISGNVDENGNLHASTSLGVSFIGKVEKNKNALGTWTYGTSEGTWKGSQH